MGRATLDGVHLKLDRAKEHFYTLTEEISKFQTDPDSYSLVLERRPNRGAVCRVARVHSPPPILGILIGECVHQYRSALDHLVYQLALANRRGRLPAQVERRAEFPIFNSGPKFRGQGKRVPSPGCGRAKICDLAPEARAIIERLQPYHRGKNPGARVLWQLQELANIDKHRLLHVTYSTFSGSTFTFRTQNVAEVRGLGFRPGPLKRDAEVARWQIVPIDPRFGTDVQVQTEIVTDIAFGKASPARAVRGQSVGKTLYDIGAFIASDVLPPLSALLGLPSKFKLGPIIDTESLSAEEREALPPPTRIDDLTIA